jgi:sugar phosphate isomerase/epimerase
MDPGVPIIWIAGEPHRIQDFKKRKIGLNGQARVVTLGPAGDPAPDLVLDPGLDLALAWETCPAELRPQACVNLDHPARKGLDCLPCPVLGWGEAPAPEGILPPDPQEAGRQLLAACEQGLELPWLRHLQVNLPLRDLLGRFRHLAGPSQINFEIGLDAEALDTLTPADLDQTKELLAGRRLTVHLPFLDLVPGSSDPLVRKTAAARLDRACDWGLELGAIQAVAHLGFDIRAHYDLPAFTRRFLQTFIPLTQKLAQNGCRLALENTFEPGPEPLLAAAQGLDAAGVEVGFCLDVGHCLCFSSTSLQDWWPALSGRMWELHLHDNDGLRDRHWPPGWGDVDWDFLGSALQRLEQSPVLTIEPHHKPHLWAFARGLMRQWGAP